MKANNNGLRYLDLNSLTRVNTNTNTAHRKHPLAVTSPYSDDMINRFNQFDSMQKGPIIRFRSSLNLTLIFGSDGIGFDLSVSFGTQVSYDMLNADLIANISLYSGYNRMNPFYKLLNYDANVTAMVTVGNGIGLAHYLYSTHYISKNLFPNLYKYSFTYGQAFNFNYQAYKHWNSSYGNIIQRSGFLGLRVGNFLLQSANDTARFPFFGDGFDRLYTGGLIVNLYGVEFGGQLYTGYHDTDQDDKCKYGCFYKQNERQRLQNNSLWFIRRHGISIEGGRNNGALQNGVHKLTNTGLFKYPGNFPLQIRASLPIWRY